MHLGDTKKIGIEATVGGIVTHATTILYQMRIVIGVGEEALQDRPAGIVVDTNQMIVLITIAKGGDRTENHEGTNRAIQDPFRLLRDHPSRLELVLLCHLLRAVMARAGSLQSQAVRSQKS